MHMHWAKANKAPFWSLIFLLLCFWNTAWAADFGDVPSSYEASQPAYHTTTDLRLGTQVDIDIDTATVDPATLTTSPNAVAAGANNNGGNGDGADEDALITVPSLISTANNYALTVPISGVNQAGKVCGWLDINDNGLFDSTERACTTFSNGASSVNLAWTGLSGFTTTNKYLRLRASYDVTGVESPTSGLASGEVEDYLVAVKNFGLCSTLEDKSAIFLHDDSGKKIFRIDNVATTPTFNPTPVLSTISASIGLTISNNLNGGSNSPTFYVVVGSPGDYYWFNGISWVATGHGTATAASAVNPGGGQSYIFSYNGSQVWRYDGTSTPSVPLVDGIDGTLKSYYDVATDIDDNFYIVLSSAEQILKYSKDGVLLTTYNAIGMPTGLQPGYAMIGSDMYVVANGGGVYRGVQSATNLNKSLITTISVPGVIVNDIAACPSAATGFVTPVPVSVSGIVFEDVNYGGGVGRDQTTASGVGVNGVSVELYDSTGKFVATTTTANNGSKDGVYTFNVTSGNYYVRVVNASVKSSRPGSTSAALAVQTFRTDGTTAVTNEIGGHNPSVADGAANAGTETLDTTTYTLSGGANVQSLQSVTLGSADITGVDFGFNFDTIVNTNDSGQGSLRQFILNSNLLGNTGLAQSGLTAGLETSIFQIPGTGPFTISPASALPNITSSYTAIDGSTQSGSNCAVGSRTLMVQLDGTNAGLNMQGIYIAADHAVVKGLSIGNYTESGIYASSAGTNLSVKCNNLGLKADGTTLAKNGFNGLNDIGGGQLTVGGTSADDRNIISGNGRDGVYLHSVNTALIQNNYIGTTANGLSSLSNNQQGADFSGIMLTGTAIATGSKNITVTDNVISGNNVGTGTSANNSKGIKVYFASFITITNNRIGTTPDGLANLYNTGYGIYLQNATDITIGGLNSSERNIISGNKLDGINTRFGTNRLYIYGNYIGLGSDGATAIGNGNNGIFLADTTNAFIGNSTAAGRNIIGSNSYSGIRNSTSTATKITDNYVGTDVSGTLDRGNTLHGVYVNNANDVVVGGSNAADGNLIVYNKTIGVFTDKTASNNTNTLVENNYIGILKDGETIAGNVQAGVETKTNIGVTIRNNLISGNKTRGIHLVNSPNTTITSNRIGTNANGTSDKGNLNHGIDVETAAANLLIDNNIISGNDQSGIRLINGDASGTIITNNRIGTSLDGNSAIANTLDGITVDNVPNFTIGSTTTTGNTISGNSRHGIVIANASTKNLTVVGNLIGLNSAGSAALGNANQGILVQNGATAIKIGDGTAAGSNKIAHNGDNAVVLVGSATNDVNLSQNSMYANNTLGIDINLDKVSIDDANDADTGPNAVLNFPLLKAAVIDGSNLTLSGCAPTGASLEFFEADVSPTSGSGVAAGANKTTLTQDYGEGEQFIARFTEGTSEDTQTTPIDCASLVGADGNSAAGMSPFQWTIATPSGIVSGDKITATATVTGTGTSEFSGVASALNPSDYSDAPSSYGTPSHLINNTFYLGSSVPDVDNGAMPTSNADGDNLVGADEDGITLPALQQGKRVEFTVKVNGVGGYLQGWIDWNGDGDFDDTVGGRSERIALNYQDGVLISTHGSHGDLDQSVNGTIRFQVLPPTNATTNPTYLRLRWSSTKDLDATTPAIDGEVEDYPVSIQANTFPSYGTGTQAVCSASNQRQLLLDPEFDSVNGSGGWTNWTVTSNPSNPPYPWLSNQRTGYASVWSDIGTSTLSQTNLSGWNRGPSSYGGAKIQLDLFWADASNGTLGTDSLSRAVTLEVRVGTTVYATLTTSPGYDFNQEGVITYYNGATGNLTSMPTKGESVNVRNSATPSGSWLIELPNTAPASGDFNLHLDANPSAASNGDDILVASAFAWVCDEDYSDAPNTYGAPSHLISSTTYLGTNKPDADAGAMPTVDADGDNTTGSDDEDGVVIPQMWAGAQTQLSVKANGTGGYLQAWFDWNGNGNFNDPGEQVATNLQDATAVSTSDLNSAAGTIDFVVTPPLNAVLTKTYARFRWSTTTGLNAASAATDGEVEDYALTLQTLPTQVCNSSAWYATRVNNTDPLNLYDMTFTGGVAAITQVTPAAGRPAIPLLYGNLAYREADGYFYGTAINGNGAGTFNTTATIVRGGGNDMRAPIGWPVGLSTATGMQSAAFGSDGYFYVNDSTGKVYKIDVTTSPPTLLQQTIPTTAINGPQDIVIVDDSSGNPKWAYGFYTNTTTNTGDFVRLDITQTTGAWQKLGSIPPEGGKIALGALYQDSMGSIYAVHNGTGNVYRVIITGGNTATPSVTFTKVASPTTLFAVNNNDGAFCSSQVFPITVASDYSDAPVSYGAPSHTINSGFYLGTGVPDADSAASPSAGADGDDTTGSDDEDGITLPVMTQGVTVALTAQVTGAGGYLQAWVDWNGDGSFGNDEQVITNIADNGTGDTDSTVGSIKVWVTVPATATTSQTYARFRWSSTQNLTATNTANDGEVEDYSLTITALPPESPKTCSVLFVGSGSTAFPTKWNRRGYTIDRYFDLMTSDAYLSSVNLDAYDVIWLNFAPSSGWSAAAITNVKNALAKGKGVYTIADNTTFSLLNALISPSVVPQGLGNAGSTMGINSHTVNTNVLDNLATTPYLLPATITASGSGRLSGSIPNRNILATEMGLPTGAVFTNSDLVSGRGRLGTYFDSNVFNDEGLNPIQFHLNVFEFFANDLSNVCNGTDYGDAPASYGNAVHTINDAEVTGLYLGTNLPDHEVAAQSSTLASGDGTDEDGVVLSGEFKANVASDVTVKVNGTGGYLQAWIDWNKNNQFDSAEQVASNVQDGGTGDADGVVNGSIKLSVTPPATMVKGTLSYARFRWSTVTNLDAVQAAADGEVEDYQVTLAADKYAIRGVIFEDINYGGGAGRDRVSAAGVGVNNARVELYDAAGNQVAVTSTANDAGQDGVYSFNNLLSGTYYVRVVNDSVSSTRAGSDGTELAVQTFRTDGTTAVTNEVGGFAPNQADIGIDTPLDGGWDGLDVSTHTDWYGTPVQSLQPVTVSSNDVTGVDFGFNFDTIVNTNDSGQGSLRQFILNSNLLGGEASLAQAGSRKTLDNTNEVLPAGYESSIFMIPNGALNGGVAKITINVASSLLPVVTGAKTILDATTQTVNVGDTNTGFMGIGGTVGLDQVALAQIAKPEVELAPKSSGFNYGLNLNAANVVVRGFAAYGFGSDVNNNGIIVVAGAGTDAIIEQNILGTTASSFTAPSLKGIGSNIQTGASGGFVRNNLIGYSAGNGLRMNGSAWTVSGNEIRSNGTGANDGLWGYVGTGMLIENNLITGSASGGYDGLRSSIFKNNTVTLNGQDTSSVEDYGVSVIGNGSTITRNIFANNAGQGVLVYSNVVVGGVDNQISQNSMYNNGKLGIDLTNSSSTNGDNVTVNDSNDTDTGVNNLLNFPQLKQVALNEVAGNVNVEKDYDIEGCAPAGSKLEFFEADVSPSSSSGASMGANQFGKTQDYGEGELYLGSFTMPSIGVGVPCSLAADADGNNPTGLLKFKHRISSTTLAVGDKITATATLAGVGTSEFSSAVVIKEIADVEVTLLPDKTQAAIGENVSLAFSVYDDGPSDAHDIDITLYLPAGLEFVSANVPTTVVNGNIVARIGEIASMNSAGFEIIVKPTTAGSYNITAEITGMTEEDSDSLPSVSFNTDDLNDGVTDDDETSAALTVLGQTLSGVVFEDINYGGGAGRSQTDANGVGINGAKVELYNSTGTLVGTTTTANDGTKDGTYSFKDLGAGNYAVRVVSDSVNSTRSGTDGTELGVQTYRTDGTTAVTNEVGGHNPSLADGVANSGTETLDTSTYQLSGGAKVQSLQPVTIASADVTGVDFGFNFDTIVNTNDAGQGSLRQFVLNANLLANTGLDQAANSLFNPDSGIETSIFMIPQAALNGTAGNAGAAVISLNTVLDLNGDAISIDGRTQTANIGDTNAGQIGTGGKVGVDALTLNKIDRPEIVVKATGSTAINDHYGTYAIIVGIAGYGTSSAVIGHPYLLLDSMSEVRACLIGTLADGSMPTAAEQNYYASVVSNHKLTLTNSYLAYAPYALVLGTVDGSIVKNNEFAYTGSDFGGHRQDADTISIQAAAQIEGNLFHDQQGSYDISGGSHLEVMKVATITNNTILGASRANIRLFQNSGASVVTKNVISGAKVGSGIEVTQSGAQTTITQNAIFANARLGIDLNGTNVNLADDVTLNDANDTDTGANNLLNFPQFKEISIAGGQLLIKGCAPANSVIELFEADVSPSSSAGVTAGSNKLGKTQDYGEGERYLGGLTEGIGEDTVTTPVNCSTLVDADGNSATGMSPFQWTMPTPSGLVSGDKITVTATKSPSGTSEFSPAVTVYEYDHGDAPASMTSIDSTLTNTYGDAWHPITGSVRLGSTIDAENAAQSTGLLANGDGADEDGVTFPLVGSERALFAAQSTDVTITTGSNGYLNAWIDWNQDGDWNDAGEQVATNVAMSTGSNTLSITANDSVPHGVTYARFRFTSNSVTSPSPIGAAADGEVEDYRFNLLLAKPAGACLGIGNTGFEQPGFPGSMYKPTEDLVPYWSTVPNSPSGTNFAGKNSIELWKSGYFSVPSYEGQYFAELNADVAGALYQDTETAPGTILKWSFAHRARVPNPSDTINLRIGYPGAEVTIGSFTTDTSAWKVYSGTYTVPAGQYITRFSFQSANGLSYGNFLDSINFTTECPDWSDAPASYGDVSHQQVLGFKLGSTFTTDAGSYHSADADGDVSDDGVTFSTLALNKAATINVKVAGSGGYLQAWMDWNNNGVFDATEVLAKNLQDGGAGDADGAVNGTIKINITVPATHSVDYVFSRFRWSATKDLTAIGNANDGEVEDYKTPVIRTDFGDAPLVYGTPSHIVQPSIYLGTQLPDVEPQGETPLDGTGDNVGGLNDEDGINVIPPLNTAQTSYSVVVNLTNTSGNPAWLVGWLDLNQNQIFDPSEALTIKIPTGTVAKEVGLNWKNISGLVKGTTYLRLRLTTDTTVATGVASTSKPIDAANDGEVEDYKLNVEQAGVTVAGRVFNDQNANGINNTEPGIKNVTVVLFDSTANTCRSVRSNAEGEYNFAGVSAGNYTLYEAANETVPTPSVCPPSKADLTDWVSSTANSLTITVANADVFDKDFADVASPSFTLDNSQVVQPNTTVVHPHVFRAESDGQVNFSVLDEALSPALPAWSSQLLRDVDCDAKLDSTDTVLTSAIMVNAGDKICLLTKVLTPANAADGAVQTLTVQSEFTYGDGATISSTNKQVRTDVTKVNAGDSNTAVNGAGKLALEKSVWNVTRNQSGETALPGETLRYTIRYENIGDGVLDELIVHDTVPNFTDLVANSMVCVQTPTELTQCTPTVDGTALDWSFTGKLSAGASGTVEYQVVVQ